MNNLKNQNEIYFMLSSDENGGYIKAVDSQKEKISNFSDYDIQDEHIQTIVDILQDVETDDFFSGWGDVSSTKELYLEDAGQFIYNLKNIDNFVDENFQKIVWSFSENELTLKLKEVDYDTDMLKPSILLNKKYEKIFKFDSWAVKDYNITKKPSKKDFRNKERSG